MTTSGICVDEKIAINTSQFNHKNVFELSDAELNRLQSQINEQLRAKRTQFRQKMQKIKRE